ncbi:MAG: serine hydrolase domain-containing protein [Pseudomonadales bacterium]
MSAAPTAPHSRARRGRLLVALLALLTAIAEPALAAAPPPPWSTLQADLDRLQHAHRVPLLVLVLIRPGEPPRVHIGTLPGRAPAGPGTPFRWGSISKTATAMTALEAARQRGIDLDTPVAQLLADPPYRNPWAPAQPLRLAHLLELSAGLADLSHAEFADNAPRPLADALARGADRRMLLWPPGLQHVYSNVPPGITAAVVETLTGLPFDAAARRLVFEPLGMTGASYQPVAGLPGGFQADGATAIPYWHMTFPAFGALNASPAAMAALLQALLDRGRVAGRQGVDAATVARMYRAEATLGARRGLTIGYGAGLYGWVRDGHLFFGHGGDADGYRSRLGLLPRSRRGYLLGINVDAADLFENLRNRVERFLSADLEVPAPPPEFADDPAALTALAGIYYPSSARFRIDRWRAGEAASARVEVAGRRLRFHRGDRRVELLGVAPGRFRRQGDPAVSVVFAERDGTLFLQGELGNFARLEPGCAGFLPGCPPPALTLQGPDRAAH